MYPQFLTSVLVKMTESEKPLLTENKEKAKMLEAMESSFDDESKSEPYHRISFVDETLNTDEKNFLKMVENGDIDGLKSRLNVSCICIFIIKSAS